MPLRPLARSVTAQNRVKTQHGVPLMARLKITKQEAEMYAIIETGGKQIKVEKDAVIYVEKLDAQEGEEVVFDKVVLISDAATKIGTPYVKGAQVTAKVEKQGKGKKIRIFKYKPKKGSTRRRQGHRQPYTKLTVVAIEG